MRSFPVLIMYAARRAAAELIWFIMSRKSNYYSYKLVLSRPRPVSAGYTVKAGPRYSENFLASPSQAARRETLNQLGISFKVL